MIRQPILYLILGLGLSAQDVKPAPSPNPDPPVAATAAKREMNSGEQKLGEEISTLKAALGISQKLLLAQEGEQGRKNLELQKSLEEMKRQCADLAVLLASSIKEWQGRLAELESASSSGLKERSDAARMEYLKNLGRLHAVLGESAKDREKLSSLAQDLAKAHATIQLSFNPAYQSQLTALKDRVGKGALKEPLETPERSKTFFSNPYVASVWTLASSALCGGMLESNKSKEEIFKNAMMALDLATRFEGDFRAFEHQLDMLRKEGDAFRADVRKFIIQDQKLVDPSTSEPLPPTSEVLTAKLEEFCKPKPDGKFKESDLHILTSASRDSAVAAELEQALFVRHLAAFAGDLAGTCDRIQKAFPAWPGEAVEALKQSAKDLAGPLGFLNSSARP
ncbi:MAG TPA: hypothetical protein VJ486_03775 [Geothrix sp.]|nr:hypothetical protein [Geothrix sp.]